MTDEKLMQELKTAQEEFSKIQEPNDEQSEEGGDRTEESSDSGTQKDERRYTETEQEAIKQGWNPDFDGPNKKSAEQFVKDGSYFRKIDAQNKEINELRTAFKNVSSHLNKIEKASYEKAFRDIKAARDAAIEVGDITKVHALDEHIEANKTRLRELDQEFKETADEQNKPVHPEALNFQERNKDWFGNFDKSVDPSKLTGTDKTNYKMTRAALTYDDYIGLKIKNGDLKLSPEQAVKAVEDFIKENYEERFENPNKSAPAAVLKSNDSAGGTKKLTSYMTERQKQQYNMYRSIDPKFGTIDDFAKHLELIGELKK